MNKICSLTLVFIMFFNTVFAESIDIFDLNAGKSPYSESSQPGYENDYIIGDEDTNIYINVNIWGEVKRPGKYKVASTTDLLTLISHSGGPKDNANIGSIKIVRPMKDNNQEAIIYVDLEEYLQTGNYDLIPVLKPGDTIIVSGNFMSYFTDFVDVITKVALIVNVYITMSILTK